MNLKKLGLLILLFCLVGMSCNRYMQTKKNADGTYNYETVPGDPMGVKIYTLANGLKVYMSVFKDAPRVQTLIATRAGSKNDPVDATGLAHYLEHMLFKGTSKIASLDWDKEKVLLKQISDLYEVNRSAEEVDRPAIYRKIDSLSGLAAEYVVAGEYDKMVKSLGSKGTNAYTSFDQTVYVNDIPTNEAEKWLKLESERFGELVLRLFHTELEAVYEEYNIAQGKDNSKMFAAFMKGLLPNHPYGTQTTIGTGEHLKTPSMEKIQEYFKTYYVPNNMAIVLSGDFNPDEMVALVEKYWGAFKPKKLPTWNSPIQGPITAAQEITVLGKEKKKVQIGWRLAGAGTDDALKAELLGSILHNGKAGLIDMNLIQTQIIGQASSAGSWSAKDYSFFFLYGEPRERQGLGEVRDFLLKEVNRVKMGNFEEWMLEAAINNMEYEEIQSLESNAGRAYTMLDAFVSEIPWAKVCDKYERMRAFSKQDVINFASQNFTGNNCVIVSKLEGQDTTIRKFEKPLITPIVVNREAVSEFRKTFDETKSPRQKPLFLDYKKSITNTKLYGGINLDYIKNKNNETFDLVYLIEMGSNADNILPIALRYLKFLGTDKYSPKEFQQELFKLGLQFEVQSRGDVSYITLSGLDRSFAKGVELFEHILAYAEKNDPALKRMVLDMRKNRLDGKKDKRQILQRAMLNYGLYGDYSPFKGRLHMDLLSGLGSSDLINKIKRLTSYEHRIFYYGSKSVDDVTTVLNKHHKTPEKLKPLLTSHVYKVLPTDANQVLFVNHKGMRQVEVLMLSKGTDSFNLQESVIAKLYNEYFGVGLSSVVFQEIRESRGLAYSAYAHSKAPSRKDKAHRFTTYMGTQADKIKDAIPAMINIVEEMPFTGEQILSAADAILKKIETERITGDNIYWQQRANSMLGLENDVRKDIYEQYQRMAESETAAIKVLKDYHAQKIKEKKYTIMVLGDKDNLDMEYLKTLGQFRELPLEQIFGY
jgi:zinc protease